MIFCVSKNKNTSLLAMLCWKNATEQRNFSHVFIIVGEVFLCRTKQIYVKEVVSNLVDESMGSPKSPQ